MKNIIVIPLDERPCNTDFAKFVFTGTDFNIILPPKDLMGYKKNPCDVSSLNKWLLDNIKDAYGVVLSIEMLLYGGLVPSRLHHYSKESLIQKTSIIEKIKSINENIKIYAFNIIMRNPKYSSNDEEPDYYEHYGKEIHRLGELSHKKILDIISKEEESELKTLKDFVPKEFYQDYTQRRKKNITVSKRIIDYVKNNMIDFLIFPQDDASVYGLTAMDQNILREYIKKNRLGLKIYMYPDADGTVNTLVTRMVNKSLSKRPLVYVKYASSGAPTMIPSLEDRYLEETVKYQIMSANGLLASSIDEADIVLLINVAPGYMLDVRFEYLRGKEYNVFRTLPELVEYTDYLINEKNKPVIIGDIVFVNGSDLELVDGLFQKEIGFNLAGYAAWNTSSNTLSTCIMQGFAYLIYGNRYIHQKFLAHRFVEDAAYQSYARQVVQDMLPEMGMDFFNVDGKRGKVADLVKNEIEKYIKNYLSNKDYDFCIKDCFLPWERLYEVGLDIEIVDKKNKE